MTATNLTLTADERAVRSVLDGVYVAWADNDPDAFVSPYGVEATAVHSGTVMENRSAIRTTLAAAFAGPLKGSRGIHDIQSVRFVGAETALVLSKAAILFDGHAEVAPESRTLDSWVLAKQNGTWRVEGFYNCPDEGA
jgi:uncharacterized protein (TIGR02246 family)